MWSNILTILKYANLFGNLTFYHGKKVLTSVFPTILNEIKSFQMWSKYFQTCRWIRHKTMYYIYKNVALWQYVVRTYLQLQQNERDNESNLIVDSHKMSVIKSVFKSSYSIVNQ